MIESRIAIDSMVLIDIIVGKSNLARVMEPVMEDAKAGTCLLYVSEISVAETVKLDGDDNPAEKIEAFLANPYFRVFPVTRPISIEASNLIRAFQLETCDSVILANAMIHGADLLYSHDGTMRKRLRAGQKIPEGVPTTVSGFPIRSPLRDSDLCSRGGQLPGQKYQEVRTDEQPETAEAESEERGSTEARPRT